MMRTHVLVESPMRPVLALLVAVGLQVPAWPQSPAMRERATAAAEAPGDRIEGTVVVVDDDGAEHGDADGWLEPTFWSGSNGRRGDSIAVVDGRFEVHVPSRTELSVGSAKLDGRFAVIDPKRLAVAAGTPIVVRAILGRTLRLHVVDAGTRRELRGVMVVSSDDFRIEGAANRVAARCAMPVAVDVESPLALEARSNGSFVGWEPTLYATAPGYAWGSIEVDYRRGGEATIALVRGEDLEVEVIGEFPPLPPPKPNVFSDGEWRAVLRLRRPIEEALPDLEAMVAAAMWSLASLTDVQTKAAFPDGQVPGVAKVRAGLEQYRNEVMRHASRAVRPVEVEPERVGSTRIAGVVPGRRTVSLEYCNGWDPPQVLASAGVDVVAGAAARATLVIEPPREAARRVRLAGSVRFSPAWDGDFLHLGFAPVAVTGTPVVDGFGLDLGDLQRVAGELGHFRFDAGEVLPGRYLVRSDAYRFQQVVDTGPDGTESAQIVIGDPADVVVHALDDLTGAPVRARHMLLWNCKRPVESTGGGFDHVEWDEARQAWCFRAPAGEVELQLTGEPRDELEPVEPRFFTVLPGRNEITVRLRRATGLRLSLEVDGYKIEWPGGAAWLVVLDAVYGGQPDVTAALSSDDVLTFRVPAPGSWRITVPSLAGYEPVAPFVLVLERGVMLEHTIVLRKTR